MKVPIAHQGRHGTHRIGVNDANVRMFCPSEPLNSYFGGLKDNVVRMCSLAPYRLFRKDHQLACGQFP